MADKMIGTLFGVEVFGDESLAYQPELILPELVNAARSVLDDARAADERVVKLWTDGIFVVGERSR